MQHAALAQLHARSYHRERAHLHPSADFRFRRNNRLGVYLRRAHFPALLARSRSTITHISVASVARFPSTKAFAWILQRSPFHARMSTSTLNWSPGTTGRRNFTSFIDARYKSF